MNALEMFKAWTFSRGTAVVGLTLAAAECPRGPGGGLAGDLVDLLGVLARELAASCRVCREPDRDIDDPLCEALRGGRRLGTGCSASGGGGAGDLPLLPGGGGAFTCKEFLHIPGHFEHDCTRLSLSLTNPGNYCF